MVGELLDALRKVEKAKAKPLLEHASEQAYDTPQLLAALLKKVIPDLQQQTGNAQPVAVHIHYGHEQARVQVVQSLAADA